MRFSIDSPVVTLLPDLQIGIVLVCGADNASPKPETTPLLRHAEENVRSQLTEENFKAHPSIMRLQEAHRTFGSNPNAFPPSVQALVKRVVKGGQLPSINPLVDIYNVISLKYLLPAGGEDLAASKGDIQLTIADGSETFVELGSMENDPPLKGEIVYRDDEGVICRKLNWREAERTKLHPGTKDCVLVMESLDPDDAILKNAIAELSAMSKRLTGARTETHFLHASSLSVEL